MGDLLDAASIQWPQVMVLGFGMMLQLWMLVEGMLCMQRSSREGKDDRIDALGVVHLD
jgi:hypothetical protein